LILICLTLPAVAWAGESATVPVPSAALSLDSLLFSDADCALPTQKAGFPELMQDPQLKGDLAQCSPFCGYTGCRGVLVGSICTKATGGQGTCYGPPMGKKCADGKPMCLCV
jgi:hypothetical protein